MKFYQIIIFLLAFTTFFLLPPEVKAIYTPYKITNDPTTGHITAENNAFKIVWHYLYIEAEKWAQGGGNIYELYDKRTDPLMQISIVQNKVHPNDTGGTAPQAPGHGGLGCTKTYYSPSTGAYYTALDNGYSYGNQMQSKSYTVDSSGNAIVSFMLPVNDLSRQPLYTINKDWIVSPDGVISLKLTWVFNKEMSINEPSYNFAFNPNYSWNQVDLLAHGWDTSDLGSDGLHSPLNFTSSLPLGLGLLNTDWGSPAIAHGQKYTLQPTNNMSKVTVWMDNNDRGFESGGIFKLHYDIWGDVTASVEFSRYYLEDSAFGYTARWFGWWGGENESSYPERYRTVSANTTFQDTFKIQIESSNLPLVLGDTNGDGVVNINDLKTVLSNWLKDLTGIIDQFPDGKINSLDFVTVVKYLP